MSSSWLQVIFFVMAILAIIYCVSLLKSGRLNLSKDNIGHSMTTLGVLALFILGVIWICMRVLHIGT